MPESLKLLSGSEARSVSCVRMPGFVGFQCPTQFDTQEKNMPKQFENPQEQKVEDETVSKESSGKRIDNVAEKAAEKASKTEQKNENDRPIFSK